VGKIIGRWVNFTLTIDPAKWLRIQLTLTLTLERIGWTRDANGLSACI
jgi:hypothetical protein